jgi:hypothetical protein
MDRCLTDIPELIAKNGGRAVACWLHEEPLAAGRPAGVERVSQ